MLSLKCRRDSCFGIKRNERGSVLIIGMLLLLMMTLLALLTTSETRTDARITANILDRSIAFQAAEAGLIAVESYVSEKELPDGTPIQSLDCFFGEYIDGTTDPDEPSRDYASWDSSNTCPFDDSDMPSSLGVVREPIFVIDQLIPSDVLQEYVVTGEVYHTRKHNLFRITVIAFGRSPSTQVVLQTVYNPGED